MGVEGVQILFCMCRTLPGGMRAQQAPGCSGGQGATVYGMRVSRVRTQGCRRQRSYRHCEETRRGFTEEVRQAVTRHRQAARLSEKRVESESRRGRHVAMGKSATCPGWCGKARRASKETSLRKLRDSVRGHCSFSMVHTARQRPRALENSRQRESAHVSGVTPPSTSLHPLLGLELTPVMSDSGRRRGKDTRDERSLLPLAGRQAVPGLCAASGAQSVVPPLWAPKARVRIKVLVRPGHPALGASPSPSSPAQVGGESQGPGGLEAEVRARGQHGCASLGGRGALYVCPTSFFICSVGAAQ